MLNTPSIKVLIVSIVICILLLYGLWLIISAFCTHIGLTGINFWIASITALIFLYILPASRVVQQVEYQ